MAPYTIAIANQKGGVGKTTTAVNLSGELVRHGYRVLLIDADPQGNATTSLGIAKRNLPATTYDLLLGGEVDAAVMATGREHLMLVPADQDLAGAPVELASAPQREQRLGNRPARCRRLRLHRD
jgi:chromosome partitioning protein